MVFEVAAVVKHLGEQAQAAANPILVSGVTGSGKSTTLSSLLALSDSGADEGHNQGQGDGGDNGGAGVDELAEALGLLTPFMKATSPPPRRPPGQTQQHAYIALLTQHGLAMQEAASRALGEIVETHFNPSYRGDTTVTLPLLKLLTAGNPCASSTHISTRIVDGPVSSADTVTLHFYSAEEIAGAMAKNTDLQRALGDKTPLSDAWRASPSSCACLPPVPAFSATANSRPCSTPSMASRTTRALR